MQISSLSKQVIFVAALLLCLTPFIDPPLALLLGIVLAQTIGHPYEHLNQKVTGWLLKASVVGLGFGMNLNKAIDAGKEGFVFTVFSILLTLAGGMIIGKILKIDKKISYLISSGTAICGGSAIAAVSPIIKAEGKQISVALGTVFILNSVALFVFPFIGHLFGLSQHQFGVWCAIAIHDTSSVVGAAAKFGQEALQVATTIKLMRALWIIPLSILIVFLEKGESRKINVPYFIGMFVLAICFSTYFPELNDIYPHVVTLAKKGLTVTLFFIGAGFSMSAIRSVGAKPLVQGTLLWMAISIISLVIIIYTT